MNEDYFDRLEAELRSAVPRASGKHPKRLSVSLRRFLSADVVVAAVSLALTAAVVLAFVVPLGGPHRSHRPSDLQHRRTGPGTNLYPFWAVPTRQQLLDNFAVLRRAQTAQDRTWQPQCGCGDAARQLNNLTRFAVALPSGYKVYLDVEQFLLGGQLDMAAGSYVLNFTVVDPHGRQAARFGPNTSYTVFPIVRREQRRVGELRSRRGSPRPVDVRVPRCQAGWVPGCADAHLHRSRRRQRGRPPSAGRG